MGIEEILRQACGLGERTTSTPVLTAAIFFLWCTYAYGHPWCGTEYLGWGVGKKHMSTSERASAKHFTVAKDGVPSKAGKWRFGPARSVMRTATPVELLA